MQTSKTTELYLLKLTQALGEFFGADCWIGVINSGLGSHFTLTQSTYWNKHCTPSFLHQPTDLSDLLSCLAIQLDSELSPIAITDLKAIYPAITLRTQNHSIAQAEHSQIRAVLVMPTSFHGDINGVIVLARSQPYLWTESDMQSLKILSTCVTVSISQMQLKQHTEQQIHYQALLDQLAIASHGGLNRDHIFELAIEGTAKIMQVSRGFVLLFKYVEPLFKRPLDSTHKIKPPQARVVVEYQYPLVCDRLANNPRDLCFNQSLDPDDCHAGTWLKATFPILEGEISQCLLLNGTELVALPMLSPKADLNEFLTSKATVPISLTDSGLAPLLNLAEMPSLLLMPLESQGRVLGCLVFQHQEQRNWQPQEIGFVKLVAAQVSTAMIQAQTLRQVQSLVDERTAQLRKSLDVQAKLYEKTRQQVDQLRQLNQVMEEFVSTMSHELRTPLTSMILAIRMLRQAQLSPEQQTKYLDILEQQCLQETNLINDLLALQKLESASNLLNFQQIDMQYVIRGVTQLFEETWAKKQMKLEVDLPHHPLSIQTDPDSLSRILSELLTNAGKYGEFGSTVRLKVVCSKDDLFSQIKLTLSNIGAGITPSEMPYIFDKFRRGQGVTQQAVPGTGLGLALVKGLVEHVNGAIAASSDPLEQSALWETRFTLTLPQSSDLLSW